MSHNIGLIDVDGHNYPNLALMKISAWHKAKGDTVEWCLPLSHYDIVYQSKVFDETYSPDINWLPQADKVIIIDRHRHINLIFFISAPPYLFLL